MASYNKVILMGHLTRDPQVGTLPNSDTPVCDFSLAVNRQWKDAGGTIREEVLFMDCVAFGKLGQTIGQHLAKGRPIHVEGRLKLDQWEQDDGQGRSKVRVVVEQFRFVDRRPGGGAEQQPPNRPRRTRPVASRRCSTGSPSRNFTEYPIAAQGRVRRGWWRCLRIDLH